MLCGAAISIYWGVFIHSERIGNWLRTYFRNLEFCTYHIDTRLRKTEYIGTGNLSSQRNRYALVYLDRVPWLRDYNYRWTYRYQGNTRTHTHANLHTVLTYLRDVLTWPSSSYSRNKAFAARMWNLSSRERGPASVRTNSCASPAHTKLSSLLWGQAIALIWTASTGNPQG
jgi:hypothetical protein